MFVICHMSNAKVKEHHLVVKNTAFILCATPTEATIIMKKNKVKENEKKH